MRYLPLMVSVLLVAACESSPTSAPTSSFINVEGSYAAISLGGNPFPIPTGETVFCRGGQVDGYLHTIRVALYDTSTDPSEPEPVWVTPIIGSEDKHCLYSDLVWGEYRATSDSLRFTNWEAGGAIYDAAWTSFPEAFRATAPDAVAVFQRTAEAPPAYYLDLRQPLHHE